MPASLGDALVGRYTIERELGRGGMATVYLARDLKHDRLVALKVLDPELGAVLGVERFLSEIRVTANLQHPHLLPLFDSGSADGLLYYVMPYVEGESLRARLERERQLPVDEALRLTIAVLSALAYAHEHGVIHRDLKPENILLQRGEPVVADFGIALAVSKAGGQRVTQTGLSLGTPQYMSPASGVLVSRRERDHQRRPGERQALATGELEVAGTASRLGEGRIAVRHWRGRGADDVAVRERTAARSGAGAPPTRRLGASARGDAPERLLDGERGRDRARVVRSPRARCGDSCRTCGWPMARASRGGEQELGSWFAGTGLRGRSGDGLRPS